MSKLNADAPLRPTPFRYEVPMGLYSECVTPAVQQNQEAADAQARGHVYEYTESIPRGGAPSTDVHPHPRVWRTRIPQDALFQ